MSRRGYGDEGGEVTTASVLRRDIPWDTYLTARLISDKDLQLIRRYDKASRESQNQLLTEVKHLLFCFARIRVRIPCSSFLLVTRSFRLSMPYNVWKAGDLWYKQSPSKTSYWVRSSDAFETISKSLQDGTTDIIQANFNWQLDW